MLCPRDNIVCDPVRLADAKIMACPRCHGIWVEQAAMRALLDKFMTKTPEEHAAALDRWHEIDGDGETLPAEFWREDTIVCPIDRNNLKKHYFPGTMIGLDHCLVCRRYWIDGDEVGAIAEYVKPDPVHDELARGYAHLAAKPINEAYKERSRKSRSFGESWQDILLNILILLLLRR